MAEQSTGLQAAADRIRDTAKWWVVSLAAIGGVLVAGSQVSDIGHLEPGSNRLYIAFFGGLLAAAGAIIILVAAGSVLAGRSVSLQSLAASTPSGAEQVVSDETMLDGYADVQEIKDEYVTALKKRKAAFDAYFDDIKNTDLRTAAEVADKRAVTVNGIANELLKMASYEHLAERWRDAEGRIIFGGMLAAIGISTFAWSAHPPADAVASTAAPNIVTAPTAKQLIVTAAGMENLQKALGKSCDTKNPIPVLLLGPTQAGPDVLVEPATGCNRIRFILGSSWGTLNG